jgi:hypothetical protein
LNDRVCTLEKANIRLAKRRRAKKSWVQLGGALSIEDSQAIIEEKQKEKRPASEMASNGEEAVRGGPSKRRCGNCGETRHNARTCKKDIEESSYSDSE